MVIKDKRRELRLTISDDDLLVEAAGLAGVSVSEFLLDRALSDAEEIVTAHRRITLTAAAYERFLAELDAPLASNRTLIEQVRRARPLKHLD